MVVACQAIVVVTFAWSAATKISSWTAFTDFRGWLTSAVGVSAHRSGAVACAVVALEAAAAAAMLVPALVPAGFLLAGLLLAGFTAGLASMVRRRVGVPCRCFGAGREPPGPQHLARNGVLLVVAATGGVLAALAPTGPVTWDTVLVAAMGAAVALVGINLDLILGSTRVQ